MTEKKINLRKLDYSPEINPFMTEDTIIPLKKRLVRTGVKESLANLETGEIEAEKCIYMREDKDQENFVKVFIAGIAATYNLNRTASRVFIAILNQYEKAPMRGGYIDWVYLAWFGEGLCGESTALSEKTFQTGLKQLICLGFISPRTPNTFWVNPSLFFKGDRVVFIKEYRRIKKDILAYSSKAKA